MRTRCKGNGVVPDEVAQVIEHAMTEIVQANVAKARAGSLQHSKFVWAVRSAYAGKTKQSKATAGKTGQSLAVLLLEKMKQQQTEPEQQK